ncbi:hypothetical protein F0562_008007 [Nyssa sinensis]|uniref:Uncharacterized protein n=1 Tax=Nyssa sinensis TaxID=561372 RepID=A0A5J5A4S7_9ASTE|nr:hypothetical protein F0562_008007 [Nyssa sinensis]
MSPAPYSDGFGEEPGIKGCNHGRLGINGKCLEVFVLWQTLRRLGITWPSRRIGKPSRKNQLRYQHNTGNPWISYLSTSRSVPPVPWKMPFIRPLQASQRRRSLHPPK